MVAEGPLHRSPLHDRHVALGAKLGEFAGWQLPMEYAGGGVRAEHVAVREAVGVFDVSHLGKLRVRGPGAVEFLNRCLTNDLDRIGAGQAQYTMCCDEETGGVVDDLIAYRYADDHVLLVPNAANTAELAGRLKAAAPPELTVTDEHLAHAVLAVQGPASERVLESIGLPAEHRYMTFVTASYAGVEVMVGRTGYTGEHGYELLVPVGEPATGAGGAAGLGGSGGARPEAAVAVWDALFAAGEPYSVRPCGLGARDTLRTEMGLALHGQDLTMEITPVQANCGWAVGWSKPSFWGHEVLRAEREQGPRRRLRGLVATGRGVPRPHMPVLADGKTVGEVTSGTYSPTRGTGIALALLDTAAGLAEGDEVTVDVRGRSLPVRVTKPPFVKPTSGS